MTVCFHELPSDLTTSYLRTTLTCWSPLPKCQSRTSQPTDQLISHMRIDAMLVSFAFIFLIIEHEDSFLSD